MTEYTENTNINMLSINNETNFFELLTLDEDDPNILNSPSLINYVGGNSTCTMLPLKNLRVNNEPLTIDKVELDQNFILGTTQIGSIFNHSHKELTTDNASVEQITKFNQLLTDIRTNTYDTCIGMMNLQMANNLFETNNIKNSIRLCLYCE